ncbi:MAG: hypothetical protein V1891_02045 [bacterium]
MSKDNKKENIIITGKPEQWESLKSISPEYLRIEMKTSYKKITATASFFAEGSLMLEEVIGGGGLRVYVRQREDGTIDMILHRAPVNGFMWMHFENPAISSKELPVIAMVDPCHKCQELIDPIASPDSYQYLLESYETAKKFLAEKRDKEVEKDERKELKDNECFIYKRGFPDLLNGNTMRKKLEEWGFDIIEREGCFLKANLPAEWTKEETYTGEHMLLKDSEGVVRVEMKDFYGWKVLLYDKKGKCIT